MNAPAWFRVFLVVAVVVVTGVAAVSEVVLVRLHQLVEERHLMADTVCGTNQHMRWAGWAVLVALVQAVAAVRQGPWWWLPAACWAWLAVARVWQARMHRAADR